MTADLVAPAILAVVSACAGGWLRRRVTPDFAVALLTTIAVVGAAAVLWALALVVVGGIIGVPGLLEQLAWCRRVLAASHQAPLPIAAGAAAAILVGAVRALRFDLGWRRTVRGYEGHGGLDVVDSPHPIAFAAPGRPGTVVISKGLLRLLDDDERAAVIAHERTHLTRHHGRYLRLTGLAAAFVPLLAPLARQLRRLDERRAVSAQVRARSAELVDLPKGGFADDADDAELMYRKVRVTGTYDPDHELLVRFRTRKGLPGYEVVTPLVVDDGSSSWTGGESRSTSATAGRSRTRTSPSDLSTSKGSSCGPSPVASVSPQAAGRSRR